MKQTSHNTHNNHHSSKQTMIVVHPDKHRSKSAKDKQHSSKSQKAKTPHKEVPTSHKQVKKKMVRPPRPKKEERPKNLHTQLDEAEMNKILESQTNTASPDSEVSFWLKQQNLQDQRLMTKAILSYIVEHRLIRDSEYNELFSSIVKEYPHYEKAVMDAMVEIVAYLDS